MREREWEKKDEDRGQKDEEGFLLSLGGLSFHRRWEPPSSDRGSEFRFQPIFFFVATCITHWSRGRKRAPRILHLGIRTGFSPTARLMRKVAFSPDEIPSARPNIAERQRKGEEKKRGKPTKGRPTRSRAPFDPRERIWILKCGSKRRTRRYAKTILGMEW